MEPQHFCYAVFNKRSTHRRRYCIKRNNGFVDNLQMRNHDCTKKDEYTKGRSKCSECAYEAYNITNMWRHCDKEKHPTGTEHGVNKETMILLVYVKVATKDLQRRNLANVIKEIATPNTTSNKHTQ